MKTSLNKATLDALAGGRFDNPFSMFGAHKQGAVRVVRTFQPKAESVGLLVSGVDAAIPMQRVHPAGGLAWEYSAEGWC